jgi:DNA repair protein RecN (Recombination protein N)
VQHTAGYGQDSFYFTFFELGKMLTELTIKDFAIIDNLTLRLHPGFNVLTGETGTGKSIIIDAVDLLLGGRGDSTAVRLGTNRAIIEGVFRLSASAQTRLNPILEENGLEGDAPDLLLLGREIRASGRSVGRVNGRAVTLSLLREIADGLLDIHGQSEHLSLLKVRSHLDLLDRYADLGKLRGQVAAKVHELRHIRSELDALLRDERALARRADLLQFQVEEIGSANLQPGEEEELLQERNRLANAEQLTALVSEAYGLLRESGSEGDGFPAIDLIDQAVRALTSLTRLDSSLDAQRETLESISYQIEDLAATLQDYRETIESEWNPRRLARVEDRLDLIHRLKRKYGDSIESILSFADKAAAELETITHSEERVEQLRADEITLIQQIGVLATDLSIQRQRAAERLSAAVEVELADLKMEGAHFQVDFQWKGIDDGVPIPPDTEFPYQELPDIEACYAFDASGIDRVEFLVATNPGEGLKPMIKIASGGETARLMLALKTVLSRADETPTLIFDEIDQGIGGRVGGTVGQKLWGLTASNGEAFGHQVMCVTHLPQLAGFGDRHFKVEKHLIPAEGEETNGERTVTSIRLLEGDDQIIELAQMLGVISESTQESAREILTQVAAAKATE